MSRDSKNALEVQRQYYTDTAEQYDEMHAHEAGGDYANMKFICLLMRMIDARTVLDVGAGTGRVIRHLLDNLPGLQVRGIEPGICPHRAGHPEKRNFAGNDHPGRRKEPLPFDDAKF